jgi:hypothetical protein
MQNQLNALNTAVELGGNAKITTKCDILISPNGGWNAKITT